MQTLQDAEDVFLSHDEVVFAFMVNFLAGIFTVKYNIANLKVHQVPIFTGSNSYNLTTLRLFFGGIGDDQATSGFLIGRSRLNNHTVTNWFHTFNLFCLVNLS